MIACYHDNSSDGEKYTKLCTDFWVDIRHSKRKFITATIEKENKFNCKGIEFEIEIRNKVKEKLWIILN